GARASRQPERDRRELPPPGGRQHAHAHRRRRDTRRPGAGLPRARRPHPRAPAPRPALPPEARRAAARTGALALDRRPQLPPRLPRPAHRAAGAGRRREAARADRADLLPAPGPDEAAVGALDGRRPLRQPLGAHLQEPPLARRRRLGRRPDDDALRCRRGPARHRHRALGAAARAVDGAARGERDQRRRQAPHRVTGARGRGRGPRAGRGDRQGARGGGGARRGRVGGPQPATRHAAERQGRTAPPLRHGRGVARRLQGDQGRVRRYRQRRRARGRRGRPAQLAARARDAHRGTRDARLRAGVRAHRRRAWRVRQQARPGPLPAARVRARPDRPAAARVRADAARQGLQAGARRRGHRGRPGLRAADDPRAGVANELLDALLQPAGHERAGPAVPALRPRPPAARRLPGPVPRRRPRARGRRHVVRRRDELRAARRLRRAARRRRAHARDRGRAGRAARARRVRPAVTASRQDDPDARTRTGTTARRGRRQARRL
ncbi:MAG: Wax ester synthase/acyl-CoA:diacylglycerol acyltransferase, partial [uncultured Solirubrobacteraceae bacterium]